METTDCLFCKIIAGEIPSKPAYQDEYVYAFYDIKPMAPIHVLVVPRIHIPSAAGINSENSIYAAKCLEAAAKIAQELGISDGYRLISNVGDDAGQSVKHLHFHILGGKKLTLELA